MYYYVDESGNTGLHLFDEQQPTLFYGVLGSRCNLDFVAEPLLKRLRTKLGVDRLHANKLGIGRLVEIAPYIEKFSIQRDLRFYLYKVEKPDHAIITFFDQVFDAGLNDAVPWQHYWTPLRYVLLFKVAYLFDEDLAKAAWAARREQNSARCEEQLVELCTQLLSRVDWLPDVRSQELIGGALKWAKANPGEINYGSNNREGTLQISPNLVGFQQVLQGIALHSSKVGKKVRKITVDRQSEFNMAQAELADTYDKLRLHKTDMGPGMPTFDWSNMPKTSPVFLPGDASAGLELVDITLWLWKKKLEGKQLPDELESLVWAQSKRGRTDEVSLAGLDRRWRHIVDLPEPEGPLPMELEKLLEDAEARRRAAIDGL